MRPLVGVGMVGMGAVMIFGGITGRLAPMLAALFVPSSLTPAKGSSDGGGFWQNLGKAAIPPLDQLPFDLAPLAIAASTTPAPAPPVVNPFETVPGTKVFTA